jgi:hypothetical protein
MYMIRSGTSYFVILYLDWLVWHLTFSGNVIAFSCHLEGVFCGTLLFDHIKQLGVLLCNHIKQLGLS